jgi:hypothetical protein
MTKFKLACLLGMICLSFWGCSEPSQPATTPPSVPTKPKPYEPSKSSITDEVNTGKKILKKTTDQGHQRIRFDQEPRLAGDFKGNYVWAAAMDLAWKKAKADVVKREMEVADDDALGDSITSTFNRSKFSKSDLDAASYYLFSGEGPQAMDNLRTGLKRKFPNNSPQLSDMPLDSETIVVFAYLYKKFLYPEPFGKTSLSFEGKEVKGFNAGNTQRKKNIRIINYISDDKFLLRIALNSQEDELFAGKGYSMADPTEVLDDIHFHKDEYGNGLHDRDYFSAPNLKLDFKRDFLNGHVIHLKSNDAKGWDLESMQEHIRFAMDEKGVEIENKAWIGAKDGEKGKPLPKNLLLNKPYWVIMKRKDSPRPYFILGVRNTAMMKAAD